jgi:DNA integrity scanning protein DisA with diadenylate cyclase activity
VDSYLSTLELQAGVIYRRTGNPLETVATIVDLHHYWNDKLWHEHRAHLSVYAPAEARQGRRLTLAPRSISLVEKMAMQLPGIDTRARQVAERFRTVREMTAASASDWEQIEGIGPVIAKRVMGALGNVPG